MARVIGIVGSRRRDSHEDWLACRRAFLEVYEPSDRLVSGGCPYGGDRFAEQIAKEFGLTITIHFPAWKTHGKRAGFMRNTEIARDADILIAVVASDRTGGTEDTIRKMAKFGKSDQVILVTMTSHD